MSAQNASIFDDLIATDRETQEVEMTMEEYLELCKADPSAYANPWQRLLKAIGEPEIIDFSKEPKLRQVFEGMPTVRYPGLADFYGIEDSLQKVVAAIRSGAQGGEESKQILYLLGPVGSSKSSLAKRLAELMEEQPFYMIKGSPVFDNPLKALDFRRYGKTIEQHYHIDPLLLKGTLSPWANKRLTEFGRDWRKFKVVKVYPSINAQRGISRVEASDKNNKDVSSIVGKVDMSKLEDGMAQHDADAYGYFGGLNRGNRGMMEYVEMFKDPIDTLNPLLGATQDRQYNGTEGIGALPFEGIILAHSNEAEWDKFCNDRTNEALIDRCKIIKVPYTLRVSAELDIYKKYIRENQLRHAPCAPGTLEMQSTFAVQSRLMPPKDGGNIETKMKIYDGERTNDPKPKTIAAYRKEAYDAKAREGMTGWSVRDSFKALSDTFNLHAAESGEVSATPVDLMYVLNLMIRNKDLLDETRDRYLALIETKLKPEYAKSLDAQIKEALVESFSSYGQNLFERYVRYAELSLEEYEDHIDPITKSPIKKADIEKELQAIEKPAGIMNATGFRNDIVRFVTRYQRDNENKMPDWTTYKKFAEAIQSKIFSSTKELMPLISFGPKGSTEDAKKHADFVDRMVARGYPRKALPQIVQWYEANKPA